VTEEQSEDGLRAVNEWFLFVFAVCSCAEWEES